MISTNDKVHQLQRKPVHSNVWLWENALVTSIRQEDDTERLS